MNAVNPLQTLTYRQLQARATRERIISAARLRFATLGYAKTSIEAIAAEAGVAVRTVYAVFGSKKAILAAVCEAWLVASDVQTLMRQALSDDDPHHKLAVAARLTRQQYEQGADVIAIFEGAARDDAEMAAVVKGWLTEKNDVMDRFIDTLAPNLAPGLDVPTARAVFRGLTVFDVYRQFVFEAGWSAQRYESWLCGTLDHQLLVECPTDAPSNRG